MDKRIFVVVAVIAIVFGFAYLTYQPNSNCSLTLDTKVCSDVPLTELQKWWDIYLFQPAGKAELYCGLELASLARISEEGKKIRIESGDTGIYITKNEASIKGSTDAELLKTCHVFSCIMTDLNCSVKMERARDIALNLNPINLVMDEELTGRGLEGMLAIYYALGAINAQTNAPIHSYIMNGENCSILTILNESGLTMVSTNKTFSCDIPGFYLKYGSENAIIIDDKKVLIIGDDDHIYAGSIIVRDILAPDLRERLNKLTIPTGDFINAATPQE